MNGILLTMKRVAVIRGGPSNEHDVSLKTGLAVLNALKQKGYTTKDIVITRHGEWLDHGIVRLPETALSGIDVAFLGLHGAYGEDGQIQRFLETHKIPFTGSRSFASAVAYNKAAAKEILQGSVPMPRHHVIQGDSLWTVASLLDSIVESFSGEMFIKPVSDGSSNAAFRVTDKIALENTIDLLLPKHNKLLVEEYIHGREATVGVLDNFRNQELYALPVVEIVPPHDQGFYSTDAKYGGRSEYICPGRFTIEEKEQMAEFAMIAHQKLGCRHYSRTDFIVSPEGIYYLETNTLPGFTEHSLFPKAARIVGIEFPELIEHLTETASV